MNAFAVTFILCFFMALSSSEHCQHMRLQSNEQVLMGEFIPNCDSNGNFLPEQCWPSTGYCWCVNIITGEEIPNTRTRGPVNCA